VPAEVKAETEDAATNLKVVIRRVPLPQAKKSPPDSQKGTLHPQD
jgi:hypothetical protein